MTDNPPTPPPQQERLYRLAGGDVERYEEHQSYISITFMTLNTNGKEVPQIKNRLNNGLSIAI